MFDRNALIADLRRDEGVRSFPYTDTTGNITIGVGRNLSADGICAAELDAMLDRDIDMAQSYLDTTHAWWSKLDDVRQCAMMNMAFNLRNRLSEFVNFLAAMQAGEWAEAVVQMRNSTWAKQVGARATRLEGMILTGQSLPT